MAGCNVLGMGLGAVDDDDDEGLMLTMWGGGNSAAGCNVMGMVWGADDDNEGSTLTTCGVMRVLC